MLHLLLLLNRGAQLDLNTTNQFEGHPPYRPRRTCLSLKDCFFFCNTLLELSPSAHTAWKPTNRLTEAPS